jgi:uncharacterized integral membrane protein (TIGR00697 family)
MQRNFLTPPRAVIFISMLYMTLFFASITVGYKIVIFGNQLYCASVLIFPLLFPLSDALAELYGSGIAKSMIWYSAICEAIFVMLVNAAVRLPSPSLWHHQDAYNFLAGGYAHILFANVTAMILSFYLNVIFLNKWRILSGGRYYYLRSVGATAVGEIAYTIITNIIAYFGILSWGDVFNIIVSDYFFKLVYSIVVAYPGALFVIHIKNKYNINSYSNEFNPFLNGDIKKVLSLSDYLRDRLNYLSGR